MLAFAIPTQLLRWWYELLPDSQQQRCTYEIGVFPLKALWVRSGRTPAYTVRKRPSLRPRNNSDQAAETEQLLLKGRLPVKY